MIKPPEPQLVTFRDFVGVDIAPVSIKTAVKSIILAQLLKATMTKN